MLSYDYSARAISPAALKAAGCTVVLRYVSTVGNPKNITKAEYAELVAAGITVGLVFETTADWALGGYAAGVVAAHAARAQASAVGYPASHALWYAIDFDTSAAAADITTVMEALHGAAAVEGSAGLVRAYGDYTVVEYAAAAGYGQGWQTVAWSRGQRSAHAAIYQTGQTATCGGVQVDINEVTGALFPAPTPPAPQPEEESGMLIIRVKGEAAVYGLSGGLLWHISDIVSLQGYINGGVKQATVSPAELAAIQAAAKVAP